MFRLMLALSTGLLAAVPSGTFEVASVRPSAAQGGEGGAGSTFRTSQLGLSIHRASLRDCVEWAYGLKQFQVEGPGWIDFDRFEVTAKAPAPSTTAELRAMLQALLADRFRLAVHRESKQQVVNVLVMGRNRSKLRQSHSDGSPGMLKLPGGGLRLAFQKTTLPELARFLTTLAAMDRPVVDGTGLAGAYDFEVDLHEVSGPWASDADRLAAPSIATVLQEQLGLKLESRKEAIEVLIIDRAEKPTPN